MSSRLYDEFLLGHAVGPTGWGASLMERVITDPARGRGKGGGIELGPRNQKEVSGLSEEKA